MACSQASRSRGHRYTDRYTDITSKHYAMPLTSGDLLLLLRLHVCTGTQAHATHVATAPTTMRIATNTRYPAAAAAELASAFRCSPRTTTAGGWFHGTTTRSSSVPCARLAALRCSLCTKSSSDCFAGSSR